MDDSLKQEFRAALTRLKTVYEKHFGECDNAMLDNIQATALRLYVTDEINLIPDRHLEGVDYKLVLQRVLTAIDAQAGEYSIEDYFANAYSGEHIAYRPSFLRGFSIN